MIVRNKAKEFEYTHNFVEALFAEDLHAKRVYSLANATLGVMTSASLAVSTIGHGLALARGGLSKHAIKQVDRLLSNPGIDTKELLSRWKISKLPWTGPTSMPITRQRSCCPSSPVMGAQHRWY